MVTDNIEIAAAFDFYSADGKTAITQELIEINLNYLRFGAHYIFNLDGWKPKIGAGLDVAFVDESTPFGDFSDTGIGAYVLVGADFNLSEKLIAGIELTYSFVTIEGDLDDEGVGGLSAMAALKFNL
jgi:opacity protein-like surface antigen